MGSIDSIEQTAVKTFSDNGKLSAKNVGGAGISNEDTHT
jgi:hypothetical protein